MTDEAKTKAAELKPDKKLIMRTSYVSQAEFVEQYAKSFSGSDLYLNKPSLFPEGTKVHLEFLLQDGQPVFRADGAVVQPRKEAAGVTCIRLVEMEPVYRGLLRKLQERRQSAEEPVAAVSGHQQSLRRSLETLVLVSEDQHELDAQPAEAAAAEGPVIGIDLGTTNSCCAIVKAGRPFVIPSRRGHNTIPSVVAIDSMGQTVVGHAARSQMEINPKQTIYGSKRLVGRPFSSPVVQQVRDRFHYEIVPGEGGEAAVKIGDRVMSLEEVAARILGEIRDVAQDYLGRPVERAVITVPAYYNENQRLAVRRAGAMADLTVERILNEPTAAALAYGLNRGDEQVVLVYDLGGGTFDASVVRIHGDTYEVLATGGDTFLGGVDFDSQLMDHIVIEFQLELGKMPQMERVAMLRALQGAEFAKCALSNARETRVRLPFIGRLDGKPVDMDIGVTRAKFEELVIPLVGRTLEVCDAVMERCGVSSKQLDAVLLVGGQTRMPLIWRMISGHLGIEPHKGVHPDEAVATGAALLAESVASNNIVTLVDVLPISIGIGVPGTEMKRVMPAGTSVTTSRTFALRTATQNQTEMELPIYQGESAKTEENEYLGTVHVRGIPPGPPGSRIIELTFALNQECLLTVSARDRESGPLSEVTMASSVAQQSLDKLLGLGSDKVAPAPAPSPRPASRPEPPAAKPAAAPVPVAPAGPPKSRGFWAFLKRIFRPGK